MVLLLNNIGHARRSRGRGIAARCVLFFFQTTSAIPALRFPGVVSSCGGVSRYGEVLLRSIGNIRGNPGMIATRGISRYDMVLLNNIGNNSRFPGTVSIPRDVSRLVPGCGYQLRHEWHFPAKTIIQVYRGGS